MHNQHLKQDNTDYPKVIFAANKFHANHVTSFLQANHIGFQACIGSYEGEQENSWIINQKDFERVKPLLIGERSILELSRKDVTQDYSATLIYLADERRESIGKMVQVSEKEAKQELGWTSRFMPSFGKDSEVTFFICR